MRERSVAPVRIATRASELARWQAEQVGRALGGAELVTVHTTGDRDQASSLSAIGGQGVFVKEVQAAVVRGEADLAVHSAKDLPSGAGPLQLAALLPRADARDAIVGMPLGELPRGARVGTSAPRRAAQLRLLRPDLEVVSIRGNVRTRLRRLGELHAIVMAVAALARLGIEGVPYWPLPEKVLCPQAGQGAIAVEARPGDAELLARLGPLDDAATRAEVEAERAVLATFGTGCAVPLGARAHWGAEGIRLRAVAVAPSGARALEVERRGSDPRALGEEVARELVRLGALALIEGASG